MSKNMSLPTQYKDSFKLGDVYTNLVALLGEATIRKLREKFYIHDEIEVAVGLRELVRYLYLCAHAPSSVFFPGNVLVDELWHSLITETKSYRELCDQLKPGAFIDHSGVTFDDYKSTKTSAEINLEQISWIASYIKNFGTIDTDAFNCLVLATELAARINGGLDEVNLLGSSILEISELKEDQCDDFDLDEFLDKKIRPNAAQINNDPVAMYSLLRSLVLGISKNINLNSMLPANEDVEKIFGSSTALAFTLLQHLASVERLQQLPDWQSKNEVLWKEITSGAKLCGLATTHLAKPGGSGIKGLEQNNNFVLTGVAPWVCGYDIFDLLLVGFETETSVVFALTDFPNKRNSASTVGVCIESQKMICLNGTSTVKLSFNDKTVLATEIISSREKSVAPVPRKSKYVVPALGIGKSALEEIVNLVSNSKHPRHILVERVIPVLKSRLEEIENLRKNEDDPIRIGVVSDEFNRDSIRLLAIAMGAQALDWNSLPARLSLEIMLLDFVVQAPAGLELKISRIGKL